jgi:hypothetical protein
VLGSVVAGVVLLWAPALASDAALQGTEGHPRSRLPLAIHATRTGSASLDAATHRAVDDWNALAREVLGVAAFAWTERAGDAQVAVEIRSRPAGHGMGVAYIDTRDGVIVPPVRVVVFEPEVRGQTPAEVLLYQVLAHELGHALGLPHTRDPRSVMCCVRDSIDFSDAAVRDAYIEARRRPDLRSVREQLGAHYERFWTTPP